jgi:hypothetical protein
LLPAFLYLKASRDPNREVLSVKIAIRFFFIIFFLPGSYFFCKKIEKIDI